MTGKNWLPPQLRYAETLAGISLLFILFVTVIVVYSHWDPIVMAVFVRGEPIMPRLLQVALLAAVYKAMFHFMNICRRSFPMVPSVSERYGDPQGFAGCTAIVTGCNTGIGLVVAKKLFCAGATVIMACRSETKAKQAQEEIISEFNSMHRPKNNRGDKLDGNKASLQKRLLFVKLDLTSIEQTKECVAEITRLIRQKKGGGEGISGIDYLVNNAGAFFPVFEHVGDSSPLAAGGVEEKAKKEALLFENNLYVNHMAPVVFTEGILPLMIETIKERKSRRQKAADDDWCEDNLLFSRGSRIINVASIAHTTIKTPEGALSGGALGIPNYTEYLKRCHSSSDVTNEKQQKLIGSQYQLYGLSKVCNILYAKHLQRRIDAYNKQCKLSSEKLSLTACSLHPGFIMTDVFRRLPAPTVKLMNLFLGSTVCKTIDEGAETTLTCIAKWGVEGGGYFVDNFYSPKAQAWGDESNFTKEQLEKFKREISGVIDDFTFGSLGMKPTEIRESTL